MPESDTDISHRTTNNEMAIRQLTTVVDNLTKDVGKMVEAQTEIAGLIKTQALQNKDMDYFREGLTRAFDRIESTEEDMKNANAQLSQITSRVDVCQAQQAASRQAETKTQDQSPKDPTQILIQNWPVVLLLLLASGGTGVGLTSLFGGGG